MTTANNAGTMYLKNLEILLKSPKTVTATRTAITAPPIALCIPNCWCRNEPPAAVIEIMVVKRKAAII